MKQKPTELISQDRYQKIDDNRLVLLKNLRRL